MSDKWRERFIGLIIGLLLGGTGAVSYAVTERLTGRDGAESPPAAVYLWTADGALRVKVGAEPLGLADGLDVCEFGIPIPVPEPRFKKCPPEPDDE